MCVLAIPYGVLAIPSIAVSFPFVFVAGSIIWIRTGDNEWYKNTLWFIRLTEKFMSAFDNLRMNNAKDYPNCKSCKHIYVECGLWRCKKPNVCFPQFEANPDEIYPLNKTNADRVKCYMRNEKYAPEEADLVVKPDITEAGIKYRFLHCGKEGKVVKEMYGDEFDAFERNRDKYNEFLMRVKLDGRMEELYGILKRI